MAKRLDFSQVQYDPKLICWGHGNKVIGPRLVAIIANPDYKQSKAEKEREKKDYEIAKNIYNVYILHGQKFSATSKGANTQIIAKITFINPDKQSVSWKQCNLSNEDKAVGFKPASGKMSISAMIHLIKNKEIVFVDNINKK